ncbi:MAG: prepilin-type N-terminal cleavage/methylation domain-containing protein [Patescibacteria group bacterium]
MRSSISKIANKGFTLIELIVAVSIIIVITSVALFHQAKFSSDILISNMAYEIALTIRQAQVYGISSKGKASDQIQSTEQYRVGYGVHFEGSNTEEKPSTFLTFIDVSDQPGASTPGSDTHFNYEYDPPTDNSETYRDLVTNTIELTQGEKIHRFCAHNTSGWNCWDTATNKSNKTLDIVFVKPNPDAHITIGLDKAYTRDYDQAKIVIESGLGDKCRTVRVFISGQVSVDAADANLPFGGCEVNN